MPERTFPTKSPENCAAVIIPEAFIWLISNPAECKFCVWNCRPCVWPNVNAVPTFTTLLSIVVEPDPKVTIPVNVACPFRSIVTPEPTLISPPVTSIPSLAVIIPTESMFLTSS